MSLEVALFNQQKVTFAACSYDHYSHVFYT